MKTWQRYQNQPALAIGLLNYADDEGYFNANPKLIKAAALSENHPFYSGTNTGAFQLWLFIHVFTLMESILGS